MDSSDLTSEQAERIRTSVARNLRYLNSLCSRMQKLGFPVDDPMVKTAQRARDATQDLHTAAHHAAVETGIGKQVANSDSVAFNVDG